MKYMNIRKTLALLVLNFCVVFTLWMLPALFESIVLQKVIVIALTVIGFLLALVFFLVNGMTASLTDSVYEKEYYQKLKKGKATDEGQNLRYNPFKLSLCKRIFWAKLILTFLTPIVAVYLFECIAFFAEMFL